jgi:hypothetical protein
VPEFPDINALLCRKKLTPKHTPRSYGLISGMTQNVGRKGKKRVSFFILGGDAASDPTRSYEMMSEIFAGPYALSEFLHHKGLDARPK